MLEPQVDIVIPHHDPDRQIGRAIRSVIDSNHGVARAIVVCHNLQPEDFEPELRRLNKDQRNRVETIYLQDATRSPAGPFNTGIRAATASYIGILGSDDFYQPGAISEMGRQAATSTADVVLAPLYYDSGRWVATPRVRPLRHENLDYVRDRLAYRTAPLGLMKRSVIEQRGLEMTTGLTSGVDIAFSTELFTSKLRIDLGRKSQGYIIGLDAPSRVTFAPRPLATEMEALQLLESSTLVASLTDEQRTALATKVTRIHILGSLARRGLSGQLVREDLNYLKTMQKNWQDIGGGQARVNRPFNRADLAVLTALETSTQLTEVIELAIAREKRASTLHKILAPTLRSNFDRESTLRAIAAEKINRLAYRR